MGLIPAKCTNCGANIQVDESKDAGICEACGTAFITEKAINNYVTNINNITNNNFAGANVTIQNDCEDIEQLIKRATTFETLNEFRNALNVYEEISSKYPMDYRGWMGIITSSTKNLTEVGISSYTHGEMLKNFDKALKVASVNEQESILKKKQLYEELCKKEIDRHENGRYNASICNLYDYRDVERALGCKCLTSGNHTFESFTFVLGNHVECSVSYMGVGFKGNEAKVERKYTHDKSTCEKNVDRSNIHELLSGYTKKSEKSGGCYVATCIYGSYDCPQVLTLRRFRDNILAETMLGRAFIRTYYAISPTLVKWFGDTSWFKKMWKGTLDRMVSKLQENGVEDTPYQDREW